MPFRCRTVTRPVRSGLDLVASAALSACDVAAHIGDGHLGTQARDQVGRGERNEARASIADAKHVEVFLGEAGQRLGVLVHGPSVA